MNKAQKLLLLTLFWCVVACILCGCGNKGFKILYGEETLAYINGEEPERWETGFEAEKAYVELVIEEAEGIISDIEKCDEKTARKKLFKGEYPEIYTSFVPEISKALLSAYTEYENKDLELGGAVTDTRGNILAVISRGEEESNFAIAKTPPYSSFKPLSVYMQMVEKNLSSWSKLYLDAPVKQVMESDSSFRDWPSNATNTYRYSKVTMSLAIKESLNTVAVRCMAELGVKNSLQYMEDKLGLKLSFERDKLQLEGEEEVYGNVALGYLQEGVSPVDMAGYYQIYANGGLYQKPGAVVKMCGKDGNEVYSRKDDGERVISRETSFIMNKLLCEVVSIGGTGEKAYVDGIDVGGKTGTGDKGNWFVGFTPQYVCAVWHGKQVGQNCSSEYFSQSVSAFPLDKTSEYSQCAGVKEYIYCTQSGKLISPDCKNAALGYCVQSEVIETCNEH